jgi:multidrug efflux pump subunit AcrA (membrane-fusion protein)
MKEMIMKPFQVNSAPVIGAILTVFAFGVLVGGLLVLHFDKRESAAPKHATTTSITSPQAVDGNKEPPTMAGMDNMSATGQTTKGKGTMLGMDMPSGSDQDMSNMPGMGPASPPSSTNYGNETMSAGTVMLSPAEQQVIGVRYTEVRKAHLQRTVRTVGVVQMDETKIAHVHVKVDGWIDKVFLDYIGKMVKKGQPLFTLYSPDLVSTEEEYLIALKGQQYLSSAPYDVAAGADSLLRATRDRLRLWDISDEQIHNLESTGKATRDMTMYSPIDGVVMARNAYDQTRVTPEVDLYDIADLSTIWVSVDIYEYEAAYIHVGQSASMELSYFPGKTYRGRVAYVYPTLDPTTRTIKVRLEFPNPGYELKPNMYANVQLNIDYGVQMLVSSEAVLNSGTQQIVFLAKPNGYFEPREIKVGSQFEGQTVVLAGLSPGEKIVASGNFLIDSESRLGTAMQGMAGMPGMSSSKK